MKRMRMAVWLAVLTVVVLGMVCSAVGPVALLLLGNSGDLGANDMAIAGVNRACRDFGGLVDVIPIGSTSAMGTELLSAAAHSPPYDLIICVGFLFESALASAAAMYPNQRFAIVDWAYPTGANVLNLSWRENEMGALIGALGGLLAATEGYENVGAVFGLGIPTLWRIEAGLRFGVEWGSAMAAALAGTASGVGFLYDYSLTFVNSVPCSALAQDWLANHAAVGVYNVAGHCGAVGALQEVANAHANASTAYGPPYYFGIDANEDHRAGGYFALASSIKRVDRACYLAVQAVHEGVFTGVSGPGGGRVLRLGLSENCIGLSDLDDMRQVCQFAGYSPDDAETVAAEWEKNRGLVLQWVWDAMHAFEEGIRTEQIIVPDANDSSEIAAVRALYPTNFGPIPTVRLSQMQALGNAYKTALGSSALSLTELAVGIAGCLPY